MSISTGAFCLVALLVLGLSAASAAAPLVLHVSPDGNDAWSGSLPEPAANRQDGPLASLTGARDAIRRLRAAGQAAGPVEVVLQDGVYRLTETLTFGPQDGGSEDAPVVYRAADDERPIISGARRLTGQWQRGANGIWTLRLPEVAAGDWYFRQLWADGRRLVRARTPNTGYLRTAGQLPGFENPSQHRGNAAACMGFQYRDDDLQAWDNLSDVNIWLYHSWTASLHGVAELDTAARQVRFDRRSGWPVGWWERNNQRYIVENTLAALDAPDEWYLDRTSGLLHYLPADGTDPNAMAFEAPVVTRLLALDGDLELGLPVESLHFVGLNFWHCDWDFPAGQQSADGQAATFLPAAVQLNGARRCVFQRCEIAHVGQYGLWLETGCKDNLIQQCQIRDLGGGGVRIGTASSPVNEHQATERNTVDNCFIHTGGRVFPAGIGVLIQRASYNTVTHCEIADFYYSGLSVGWSWGYAPSSAHHNVLEYNHVHHLGWGVLSDMGGIYTLGVSPGTRINHNIFHDVKSVLYGGWGLYTDEGSTDVEMAHNIVYRTHDGSFHQHYGRDNRIHNNILVDSATRQVTRSRQEDHNSFFFQRNIVVHRQGTTLGGNWSNGNFTHDHNLYWHTIDPELLDFDGETLAGWQARGHDAGSIVADPGFTNPAADDYTLRPDSPALALGFQPIDTSRVGLYGEEWWTSLPAKLNLPPFEFDAPAAPEPIEDDFESTPVGSPAARARTSGEEKGASIRVTDETAATGRHSLKFVDAPGLAQEWQPHLHYSLNHRRGQMTWSFALRVEPGAKLYAEVRDSGGQFRTGPTLSVAVNGDLLADTRKLLTLPHGVWCRFTITCGLGARSSGSYDLIVQVGNGEPQRFEKLPFKSPTWRSLNWLGFVSTATDTAIFYLDDLKLMVE